MTAPDVIRLHWRSAAIGAVAGLLLGGTGVSIVVGLWPDSRLAQSVAGAFAGQACRPAEHELAHCRAHVLCLRALCDTDRCTDGDGQ